MPGLSDDDDDGDYLHPKQQTRKEGGRSSIGRIISWAVAPFPGGLRHRQPGETQIAGGIILLP